MKCAVCFAAIIHEITEEKQPVTLLCPPSVPVDGAVTWIRDTNGHRVDLLTVDADGHTRHDDDRLRRYRRLADKSLYIYKATVSDTGRYFCNNKPAVDVTVIPKGNIKVLPSDQVKSNIYL